VTIGRQPAVEERSPDQLVHRVVAADVLPKHQQLAFGIEKRCRVEPPALRQVAGHAVRCHRAEELTLSATDLGSRRV